MALANEGGGYFFVRRAKPPREVVGSRAFPDTVVAAEKLFQALGFRVDIEEVAHPQGRLKPFEGMDGNDRVRDRYQQCALKWVMAERMTNPSLRDRFRLVEDKAAIASQIISTTIDAGLIKPDESVGASRKYARYPPFWA